MTLGILKVILMVGLYCGISQAEDRPLVRCEASAVHIGGEGQVTCHYPMDLSQNDYSVGIEQLVDESETTVLDCVRDRISHCDNVRQGYRITNFTGNTLTVTIPKVTDEHRGIYACTLADRKTSYASDLCTFEVKGTTPHSSQPESSTEKAVTDQSDRPLVRCEASAVHIGGEGQVTCHYPMDLSQNDYSVGIEQFVDESEKTVLECVWDRITQCDYVRQGYRVTNVTGNTLTVTIPKVTDEHRGRYRCTLVDRKTSYASDLCTFKVKGTTSHSSQPESSTEKAVADQSGTTPHSSQSESSTEKAAADQSDADKRMSGVTITVSVIIVNLITVLMLVGVFWTYKQCRRQNGNIPATAKFDNSADSQKKEVCRVNVDDHLEGNDAITGGKDTNNEPTNPATLDSGFFDTKTESEYPAVIKEEDDQIWFHSPENREMAENAERQDAASDAEDTADNTAPLLSDKESRPRQDAELKEEEQDELLASSGDQGNLDTYM